MRGGRRKQKGSSSTRLPGWGGRGGGVERGSGPAPPPTEPLLPWATAAGEEHPQKWTIVTERAERGEGQAFP